MASSFYTYAIATFLGWLHFCQKHWRGLFKQPKSIVLLAIASGWTNLSYVMAVLDGEVYAHDVAVLFIAHLVIIVSAFLAKRKNAIFGLCDGGGFVNWGVCYVV